MDLVPAIFLLGGGAILLFIGFYFNRDEDHTQSQSGIQVLRKEINALRDEVRRNDAKNDLVQREILLVREALPESNGSCSHVASSSEDTIRGVLEPRFGVLSSRAEKQDGSQCQDSYWRQDQSEDPDPDPDLDLDPSQDQEEDCSLTQNQDTITMLYNKYKRA
ncbi:MAG: hypothetical protein FWG14_01485 [Peptococcaceae bacterium]|nr:hypothetical protein [Peptococcaceae bacterium]